MVKMKNERPFKEEQKKKKTFHDMFVVQFC